MTTLKQEREDPVIKTAISKIIKDHPHIDIIELAKQIGMSFSAAVPEDILDSMSDRDKLMLAKQCTANFQTGIHSNLL